MAGDESVDYQTTTLASPPSTTKVAADVIAGVAYQRAKIDLGGDGVLLPLVGGQQVAASSVPVTLTALEEGLLGALTETAPASDTASSGLNGRAQRIAQNITSLIAKLPAALGAGGGLKIDGSGTALPISEADGSNVALGTTTDASSASTVIGLLKKLVSLLPTALVGGKLSVTTATTITPTWGATTTAVFTPQMLAKAATPLRATLNLVAVKGGYLKLKIFRSGATAIDVAIQVRVRRITGDSPIKHSAAYFAYTCGKTTAVSGVAAAAGNNAGVNTLTINAAKTYAASANGDIMLGVIDNTTTPTTASELLRQAFATSTTAKLLEFPTESAHNSTAHVVADQAEALECYLEGGETYEITIDYSNATTGDSVYVDGYFNPYNSDAAA